MVPYNINENISLTVSNKNLIELHNGYILMKSNGRECLKAFTKTLKTKICFNIYNTPNLKFKEKEPIIIETNTDKQLHLDLKNYPKSYIKYQSNYPDIIKINEYGKITSLRPGRAIITAKGLDTKNTKIKILSISKNGLINNDTLNKYNVSQYKNLMIVSHPDDETLWGGAHLLRERYFVICLTNGYNIKRANDFREILNFTNNQGLILNYPDLQDNVKDDWSGVSVGIIRDLSTIIKYKYWDKIATHDPYGTTGHIHHKKTSEYVTKLAKQFNLFNHLYYFGKFYKKNAIPPYLPRINDKELFFLFGEGEKNHKICFFKINILIAFSFFIFLLFSYTNSTNIKNQFPNNLIKINNQQIKIFI